MNEKISSNGHLAGTTLERVLRAGHFAVTAELGPPQSADGDVIRRQGRSAQRLLRCREHHR